MKKNEIADAIGCSTLLICCTLLLIFTDWFIVVLLGLFLIAVIGASDL